MNVSHALRHGTQKIIEMNSQPSVLLLLKEFFIAQYTDINHFLFLHRCHRRNVAQAMLRVRVMASLSQASTLHSLFP
jgi:uncharacterized protein YbcV (DUF1398 family)